MRSRQTPKVLDANGMEEVTTIVNAVEELLGFLWHGDEIRADSNLDADGDIDMELEKVGEDLEPD